MDIRYFILYITYILILFPSSMKLKLTHLKPSDLRHWHRPAPRLRWKTCNQRAWIQIVNGKGHRFIQLLQQKFSNVFQRFVGTFYQKKHPTTHEFLNSSPKFRTEISVVEYIFQLHWFSQGKNPNDAKDSLPLLNLVVGGVPRLA